MNDVSASAMLLASGGLDSTTLAYWMLNKGISFIPLFVNYGQHCADTELETLKGVLPFAVRDRVDIVNVSDVYTGSMSRMIVSPDLWQDHVRADDLYLPYRNTLLLTIAAAVAQKRGCRAVYAAFINSNHAKEIDCSAAFFAQLGNLLAEYGSVRLEMPFRDLPKTEVARIGISLGAPIGQTFSCQVATSVPCGACPNCVDRLEALSQLT